MRHARADYQHIQDPKNKIGQEEPVFLFRAQDKHMATILKQYQVLCSMDSRRSPEQIKLLADFRRDVIAWQKKHGAKVPDWPVPTTVEA